jgi:hypothetical protein
MTTTSSGYQDHSTRDAWAGGLSVFGGTVLATLGLFQFFEGLSAVLSDKVFVTTPNYVYQFDITTWGWIHIVVGLVAVAVGIGVLMGQTWGLITGIIVASLSALTQFMFLPWAPIWAIVIIGFDIAVIWALCVRMGQERPTS